MGNTPWDHNPKFENFGTSFTETSQNGFEEKRNQEYDPLSLRTLSARFQPIVKPNGDNQYKIVGFETLARRENPDGTPHENAPGDMFQKAKGLGKQTSLFLHMLKQAYEFQKELGQNNPHSKIYTSVNLDIDPLYDSQLISNIRELQANFPNVAPNNIVIEILEDAFHEGKEHKEDTAWALNNIKKLKHSLGFRIAIDDFGKSSSDFIRMYDLKALDAFDILKFDNEILEYLDRFENEFPSFHQNYPEASEFLTLRKEMEAQNIPIVVEGIETKEQETLVRNAFGDNNYMQGYLCSKPVPKNIALELAKKEGGIINLNETKCENNDHHKLEV